MEQIDSTLKQEEAGSEGLGSSQILMGMFLELISSLQSSVLSLLQQGSVDTQVSLEVTMAFKDAQIKLIEETKKISSIEFCTSLKQSFNKQQKPTMTFGAGSQSVRVLPGLLEKDQDLTSEQMRESIRFKLGNRSLG